MKRRAFLASFGLLSWSVTAREIPPWTVGRRASVLIFTTTDCPIANAMLPELHRLQQTFTPEGVTFTLIYIDPATTEEQAREHAKSYHVSFPFLLDPQHHLVRQLRATRTPEAFLLTPDGQTAYHGRINNLYHAPGQRKRAPSSNDLEDALKAVVRGRAVDTSFQPAVGCIIADFAR